MMITCKKMQSITIPAGSQKITDRIRINPFLLQQKLLKKYKQKIYKVKRRSFCGE